MQSIRTVSKRQPIRQISRTASRLTPQITSFVTRTVSRSTGAVFRAPSSPLLSSQRHSLSSKAGNMTSIESIITPQVLKEVEDFWFEHLPAKEQLIIPGDDAVKKWFFGGEEMDKQCSNRFSSVLEALQSSGATSGKQIIDAVKPQQACEWLSLVLLLDQMPRNCYRGDAAAVVYNFFDPLALEITRMAIAEGMADSEPEMRWRFAQRTWFYLPLQHAEDKKMHEEAMQEFELVSVDVQTLAVAKAEGESWDEYKKAAWHVVQSNKVAAKGFAMVQMEFQRRHTILIDQFGRYPHRNEALKRPFTEEEKKHLESGGDSFGSGKSDDK